MEKVLHLIIGLIGMLAAGSVVMAQTPFPSKAVTLVVPFPPGGALDIVARAAPDGYTIALGSVATHAIAPGLYPKLSYDALKDFAPITQVTSSPLLVASSAQLKVTTLPELIATVRAQPGKLNYASPGNGTAVHLAGELLKSNANLDVLHVPYMGGAEAITALMTGEAAFMVVNVELVLPQVRGGKARALAVTGNRRLAILPDLPTLHEAGFAGAEVSTSFGLFEQAGTPKPIVDRLHRDAATSLQTPKERFAAQGDEVVGSTPEEFAVWVRAEHGKSGKVIKDFGVKIEGVAT